MAPELWGRASTRLEPKSPNSTPSDGFWGVPASLPCGNPVLERCVEGCRCWTGSAMEDSLTGLVASKKHLMSSPSSSPPPDVAVSAVPGVSAPSRLRTTFRALQHRNFQLFFGG